MVCRIKPCLQGRAGYQTPQSPVNFSFCLKRVEFYPFDTRTIQGFNRLIQVNPVRIRRLLPQ